MAAYLRHSTRGGGLTPKDAALPENIAQEHERIRELSEEKVACAERVVHLLTKAMGRLDVDLARAMDRTGEGPPQDVLMGNTGGSRTPIEKLPETLKSALAQSDTIVLPVAGQSGGSGASTPHLPNKRMFEIMCY
jgi:chromatin modification-related protein YNG2